MFSGYCLVRAKEFYFGVHLGNDRIILAVRKKRKPPKELAMLSVYYLIASAIYSQIKAKRNLSHHYLKNILVENGKETAQQEGPILGSRAH